MNEQLSMLLGLGPNAEWPHTEKSLIEIINLQREKEVTKQQYYKLENTNKSIELLNGCLSANIPSVLIPIVFSGEPLNEELMQKVIQTHGEQPQRSISTTPQIVRHNASERPPLYANYQYPPPQQQQQQQQQPQHQQLHQQSPINLGPPVNFHSRPLSPAKIGAAAVAQLDRQRYPMSPIHRRNQSMPINSNGIVSSAPPSINVNSPSYTTRQSSMMGTMSSIQFINENPGKLKRRRSSLVEENEEESEVDENESVTEEKKKFIRAHHRTRSDTSVLNEKKKAITPEIRSPLKTNNKDENIKDKTEKLATPSLGPKFANDILSPSVITK